MINKFKKKGPQVISNLLPDIAKKTLKRRGFFEIELLKNWENLIEKKYQNLLEPISLVARFITYIEIVFVQS